MATEFFIPKLGQTVEEVTLIDWLVEDGVQVEAGQPILEVETDKAVFPVEANATGYLHRGPYEKGDVIPVVTVVAVIGGPDDWFRLEDRSKLETVNSRVNPSDELEQGTLAKASKQDNGKESEVPKFISPRARRLARKLNIDLSRVPSTGGQGSRVVERDVLTYLNQIPKATPLAQRMAAEAGIDLKDVSGTGPKGRITRADVERSLDLAQSDTSPNIAASLYTYPPAPPSIREMEVLERLPLTGVRGVIAERMAISVHTTARVTLMMEVDATELSVLRERLKAGVEEEWGFAPGYNDLLGKIVAAALRKLSYMNARLTEDAIEILGPINLGMAVDTERGLLVPVIRDADRISLHQFGVRLRELVGRARNGRSLPDDLSGGTFTISNLGSYDVDGFTPVINPPEAAILGIGRIAPKVVPIEKEITVRKMCTLSLVFDHRLVDGAPAARFLKYIKDLIEEPYLLINLLQET